MNSLSVELEKSRVLELVRQYPGGILRSELQEKTGLTKYTLSRRLAALKEEKVITLTLSLNDTRKHVVRPREEEH